MKFWDKITEQKLRHENVSANQFDFMPERSTMEAINILGKLLED